MNAVIGIVLLATALVVSAANAEAGNKPECTYDDKP